MNDHPALIFAAAMIFTYGLFSKIADRSPVTAPMVFVAMGILVGPVGLNFFALEVRGELIHILTEVTLVLILFVDASTINLKQLIQDRNVPIRLLLIGLPLTMLLGTAVAYMLFSDVSIWQLILMALILSPTDAALGITKTQYDVGQVDFLSVLQLQARTLNSQIKLIRIKNARLAQRIDLHLALGGDFSE